MYKCYLLVAEVLLVGAKDNSYIRFLGKDVCKVR